MSIFGLGQKYTPIETDSKAYKCFGPEVVDHIRANQIDINDQRQLSDLAKLKGSSYLKFAECAAQPTSFGQQMTQDIVGGAFIGAMFLTLAVTSPSWGAMAVAGALGAAVSLAIDFA